MAQRLAFTCTRGARRAWQPWRFTALPGRNRAAAGPHHWRPLSQSTLPAYSADRHDHASGGDDTPPSRHDGHSQPASLLARTLYSLQRRMPRRPGRGVDNSADADGEGGDMAADPASIARLLQLARPESRALSLAVTSLFLTTGVSLVFPAAVGRILDSAIGDAAMYTPTQVAVGLMALFSVQAGLIVGRGVLLKLAGERIAARLRNSVFGSMIDQEVRASR